MIRGIYFDSTDGNSGGADATDGNSGGADAIDVSNNAVNIPPLTSGYKNLLSALNIKQDTPTIEDTFPSARISPVDLREMKGRYFGSLPIFTGGEQLLPITAINKNINELERRSALAGIEMQEERDETASAFKRQLGPKPYEKQLDEQYNDIYNIMQQYVNSGDKEKLAEISNPWSDVRKNLNNKYAEYLANVKAANDAEKFAQEFRNKAGSTLTPIANDYLDAMESGYHKDGTPITDFDEFGKMKSKVLTATSVQSLMEKENSIYKPSETTELNPVPAVGNTLANNVWDYQTKKYVSDEEANRVYNMMLSQDPEILKDNALTKDELLGIIKKGKGSDTPEITHDVRTIGTGMNGEENLKQQKDQYQAADVVNQLNLLAKGQATSNPVKEPDGSINPDYVMTNVLNGYNATKPTFDSNGYEIPGKRYVGFLQPKGQTAYYPVYDADVDANGNMDVVGIINSRSAIPQDQLWDQAGKAAYLNTFSTSSSAADIGMAENYAFKNNLAQRIGIRTPNMSNQGKEISVKTVNVGDIHHFKDGDAKWDGSQWIPVK